MPIRALLLAPAATILCLAIVLVAASVLAWGSANEVGYPAWLPTLGGAIFALPLLVGGWILLVQRWHG